MSDEEKEATEPGTGGRGGGWLGILATALLAGLFGAAGTVAVQHSPLGPAPPPAPVVESTASGPPPASTASAEDLQARLISFEPIVVNIAGSGGGRFLKVTVAVVTDSVAAHEELGMRMPQVKDAMITLMSSKRVVDVADFEGKVLLKEDLRDRIDAILTQGSVESVLLTEFVVQ